MNLRYLLVDVDGVASFGSQPWHQIRGLVGPPEPAAPVRVRLLPEWHMAGWVNDVGHLFPHMHPRNVVGSVLLASCGASQLPYAGRVIVTGAATWRGESEVAALDAAHVEALTTLTADIRKVLGLEPGTPTMGCESSWARDVRTFAEHVRSGPTPGMTIIDDPRKVRELLHRMGGVW